MYTVQMRKPMPMQRALMNRVPVVFFRRPGRWGFQFSVSSDPAIEISASTPTDHVIPKYLQKTFSTIGVQL